ncbi:hypothetical protein [Mycolicibacterium iranicum]|uniref:hypothetical protein n=1 Tax=Mycolicibacterium iranicum TaxID=912594 RepID=UPI001F3EB72D|nr:hypothetical protein [Mycolicibacterium iranicum]
MATPDGGMGRHIAKPDGFLEAGDSANRLDQQLLRASEEREQIDRLADQDINVRLLVNRHQDTPRLALEDPHAI